MLRALNTVVFVVTFLGASVVVVVYRRVRDVVWSLAHYRRRVMVASANGQLYRGYARWRDGNAVNLIVPKRFAGKYDLKLDWSAWRPLADEGVTWCYGWGGDRVAALEVARALRSS